MLILSRKMGETICLPGTNTTIKVQHTSSGRVSLAFDAPPDVAILRGELLPVEQSEPMPCEIQETRLAVKPR